jgi:hypothetical protein
MLSPPHYVWREWERWWKIWSRSSLVLRDILVWTELILWSLGILREEPDNGVDGEDGIG